MADVRKHRDVRVASAAIRIYLAAVTLLALAFIARLIFWTP